MQGLLLGVKSPNIGLKDAHSFVAPGTFEAQALSGLPGEPGCRKQAWLSHSAHGKPSLIREVLTNQSHYGSWEGCPIFMKHAFLQPEHCKPGQDPVRTPPSKEVPRAAGHAADAASRVKTKKHPVHNPAGHDASSLVEL